ncbi:MAG: TAXI family TRAP transporter solute-binding subunit [Treponema sp.]|jgi:TRAP transporter TAXI family solute receptor|nr:TAXI family TRAP transporter solute-binding subunit [Treponema sp.]
MKKLMISGLYVILGAAVLFASGQQAGKTRTTLRMATGGNTGTYYAYGSAVGQILSEKIGIPIAIQSTGASKANIQLIAAQEVELAIVQNDIMDYAYNGTELFIGEQTQSFSTIAALYAEVCQIIANPASGISTIADLKGKRVSVGDAGSGTEFNAQQILRAYGIELTDIDKQNLSFGASADALRDNKIDAFFCTAGAPTIAIVDLSMGRNIVLLEIDNDHAAQLIRDFPFYTHYPIPARTYRGVDRNVQTLAVKATLIANNQLSEDTVYNLTKNLFESKEQIQNAHVKGTELATEYAVSGISVPFHPGAARYFREIGVLR